MPFACKICFEFRRDKISSAVSACSATSMHWIICSFSRNTGMPSSAITLDDLGSDSIMYVSARHA